MSTFFVCAPLTSSFALNDTSVKCSRSQQAEKVKVKWVYDGDTLKLSDNRKLRIIGIDTPESAWKKDSKKQSEAFAGQATEALRELLSKHQNTLYIEEGRQNKDKYGRLLAYVFTPDGINVSEWLLQQGLASLLVIPPNHRYIDCFRNAEKTAQTQSLSIWGLAEKKVIDVDELTDDVSGYVRLKGTVKRIKRRKNKISIALDHEIYITIKQPDLGLFKDLDVTRLKGESIQVTGILYRYGKKGYIRVRHPVYIEY